MKILLIIHHYLDPNSGAPGSILKLGECYQAAGHSVEYYSFDDLPQWIQQRNLSKLLFPLFVVQKLRAYAQDFDVVDASTGDAWLWGRAFKPFTRNPALLVTRSHGLDHFQHLGYLEEAKAGNLKLSWKYFIYNGGFHLWEVASSLRCADLVFLLNQEGMEYSVKHLGVSPDKIRIVQNGIPSHFIGLPIHFVLKSEERDGALKIAQIGSYISRKGIQYGVPALNTILSRYPHVKVTFFGTGVAAEQVLEDFLPAVRDQVTVVPKYEHAELPKLLQGHQIKLFPTLSEGFAKSLVEAMAGGLAPVATDIPGSREILQDNQNSIVVPPRNQAAIEVALEKLITQPGYLDKLRQNAYFTAQSYSWAQVAQKRLKFYTEALPTNQVP